MKAHCSMCGRYDYLDMHHIFNGAYRTKSEKYGAYTYICRRCHEGVHKDAQLRKALKAKYQLKIMKHNEWSVEQFIKEFGKNYL